MTKSYIYTLVNRLGHLYFIILFALAYIFANFNTLFSWHNVLGVLFLLGICFRIFWGFIGTKYSRFKDFEYKGILAYFLFYFKEKRIFISHNPASSFAIILMLFQAFWQVLADFQLMGVSKGEEFSQHYIFITVYLILKLFIN